MTLIFVFDLTKQVAVHLALVVREQESLASFLQFGEERVAHGNLARALRGLGTPYISPRAAILAIAARLFADENLLRVQKIGIVQVREFHVAASRLSECADQEIDLARARGFELDGFLVGVRLGVVVVRLRPILGVETELDLEPAVEERHDCHHPRIDGLRLEGFVVQFVLVLENILAAVFVRELFSDESDEIAEVLALGLHVLAGRRVSSKSAR